MFYQIFFSPQVKRLAIITYKDGIYELPHDLPHEFITSAQPPPIRQNESPVNTSRKTFEKQKLNFSRCALLHMKTRVSLKYLVSHFRLSNHVTMPIAILEVVNP